MSNDVEIHTLPKNAGQTTGKLNKISGPVFQDKSHGGAQAMLYATGLTEEDMSRPQVGISPIWWEGNPCNSHLLNLAQHVKEGCKGEELVGLIFSSIGISDAITMGTDGMRYSDIIADSIESVVMAQHYDGKHVIITFFYTVLTNPSISLPGCDKNMPGCLMAAARHNRPTIIVYGGTIQPGTRHVDCPALGFKKGGTVNISDAFESYGTILSVIVPLFRILNKMKCMWRDVYSQYYVLRLEVLGMSLPYSASIPASYPEKKQECVRAAKYLKKLLDLDIKPRDILTRQSFLNAITVTHVLGGSTNSVLHFLAMARAADVHLTIDDFQEIGNKTPYLANLSPSGKFYMEDLHKVGGIPALLKYLLNHTDLIDGNQLTVTGKTIAQNLEGVQELQFDGQEVVYPLEKPIKPTGHLTILRGNLAPESAVAKITGKEGLRFEGTAKCFDSLEGFFPALERGDIKPGMVLIFRYQGPKGAPGMPEMLGPTGALAGAGLLGQCALITDGRFSGASRGLHYWSCLSTRLGGPIALVEDGDSIIIDTILERLLGELSLPK
ncbi:dihydroxy-acid dehydratase [Flagelloscypha sp. PMI_526]|nr:dihydroxy-acid dehydratase [Flagelloscypha sp. PMI_526]